MQRIARCHRHHLRGGAEISLAGNSALCRGPSRRWVMLSLFGTFLATPSPGQSTAMRHVALLGDSVFDNAAYVGSGPELAKQLRSLSHGFEVTLLARDGATITDVDSQSRAIDPAASHLVISIGG